MNAARGFLLLPVVVTLALLAAVAFLLSREGGMSMVLAAREYQADAARYVAEAGLARMNHRAQGRDCTGYGSLNNVAFGADTFSASSSPSAGSPVTLTATATLASGAKATLTRANVVVRKTTPYVMTLQPGAAGADTYVDSSHQNFNFGAGGTIAVKHGQFHSLLQFSVSAIPAGAYIQSAQLELYSEGSSSNSGETVTAFPVTRAWAEGTGPDAGENTGDGATWKRPDGGSFWTTDGGDFDGASGIGSPFLNLTGWNAFDVTPFVAGWVAGTTPNYGVLLKGSPGISLGLFISGENPTVSRRPKLTVTFLPPCGWSSPVTTVTLGPTADSYVNGASASTNYGSATTMWLYESGQRRAVLRFDTSGVSAGTALASATLRLYVSNIAARSGGTMNLAVHALTSAWTQSSVSWTRRTLVSNWASAGGDYQASAASTLPVPASFNSGWIEFDVKSLAQAWVDGVIPANGVIVLEGSPDQIEVASVEGSAATRPELVLSY